jgi:heme A synthase
VMGGLTAKYPGAAVACRDFPLCGANPDVLPAAVHVQLTHRVLAVLVVLHLIGLAIGFRRRREPAVVRRAATIACSLGVLQLLVAGAMIGLHLPPVLRSLHEAMGVSIWIAAFALAYLTRLASGHGVSEPGVSPGGDLAAVPPASAALALRTTMGHTVAVIVARGAES